MADLASTVARSDSLRTSDRITDAGYFGGMTSQQLDRAAAPLALIAKSKEMSVYSKDLSVTAKRNFLTRFWAARDPSPDTPRNESREQFYGGIAYADSNFREHGRIREPGWRTDRGRIYVRLGSPDETLRRVQQGNAPPYEAWRYNRGKGNYYIFADLTGVGGFKLMHSDDVHEVGDPNWQRILGASGPGGHREFPEPRSDRVGAWYVSAPCGTHKLRVFEASLNRGGELWTG